MDRKWILNEDGEPVETTLLAWARWMEENRQQRILAATHIDAIRVSTVFLGLDMRTFLDRGKDPVLWETMVFDSTGTDEVGHPLEGCCMRYTSRVKALTGHWATCRAVHDQSSPEEFYRTMEQLLGELV